MLRKSGFLLDLARVQSLPSAAPTREEPRDAVSSGHGMCVFTEPTGRKSGPARAKRRTRTRIALLTVHNSSSCFLFYVIAPARLRHAYRVHVKSRGVVCGVRGCGTNVASGRVQLYARFIRARRQTMYPAA